MAYLRLRQICLAASNLEPAVADLAAIFETSVCVRDFHVDIYGLTNALLPIGDDFVEIVAPGQPGTAVERFIERSKGRGGYMAIFECDDPEERQMHVEALGIRMPHIIDRPEYRNIQLHPKDCRATILEFARSSRDHDLRGNWWPAGPKSHQASPKSNSHAAIVAVEVTSPDPKALAEHWAGITKLPVLDHERPTLSFDNGKVLFTVGNTERLDTVVVAADNPGRVLEVAKQLGRSVGDERFELAGVGFRIVAA